MQTVTETVKETTTLNLYFADHGDEETPVLQQLFKDATVFVWEHSCRTGSDHKITERANALAEGRMLPEQFQQFVWSSTPLNPLPRMLANSWLRIVLEQSPLSRGEIEEFHKLAWQDPPESLPLDKQLNELRLTLAKMADYDRRRDKALAAQLKRLHQQNPNDSILVLRGSGHRLSLPAECRKVGLSASVIIGPCNPLAQNEVIAQLAAGQQPTHQQLMEALAERRNNMRVADKPQDFSQFPL
jgi:hypothetical protein